MANGTPCLVTPVGSLPEVVDDFAPEFITSSRCANSIAAHLDEFLRGRLRAPSAESCKAYVKKNYDG